MDNFKGSMSLSEVNNILNAISMGSNSANNVIYRQVFHKFSNELLENFLLNSDYELGLEAGFKIVKESPVGSISDYHMIKETQFRFTQHLVRYGYSEKQFYKWLLEEELTEEQKNIIKKCLKKIEMKTEMIFEAFELCKLHMEHTVKMLIDYSKKNSPNPPLSYN